MLSRVHLFATLMDGSPPGSSVHGIFQARILEWLPFPTPGDLSNPGIEPTSLHRQTDSLSLSHLVSPTFVEQLLF